MKGMALEAFLARLFVDPAARARFAADPVAEGKRARLSAEECAALLRLDRVGLELASRSFAVKRRRAELARSRRRSLLGRLAARALGIVLPRRGRPEVP
jgi:hypothetical protein